jgi:hypothetical protein
LQLAEATIEGVSRSSGLSCFTTAADKLIKESSDLPPNEKEDKAIDLLETLYQKYDALSSDKSAIREEAGKIISKFKEANFISQAAVDQYRENFGLPQ